MWHGHGNPRRSSEVICGTHKEFPPTRLSTCLRSVMKPTRLRDWLPLQWRHRFVFTFRNQETVPDDLKKQLRGILERGTVVASVRWAAITSDGSGQDAESRTDVGRNICDGLR